MAEAAGQNFVTQAEFARRRKVSRKSVTAWKSKGLLVLNEAGLIDVEATEWKLDDRPAVYRGGVTHRPVRGPDGNNHGRKGNKPEGNRPKAGSTKPKAAAEPLIVEESRPSDGAPEPADFDTDDPNLTHAEAVRRKENFLGLLRKQEFEVAQGKLVDIDEVGRQVEREYAVVRERLLAIPGKLAAKLVGLDRAPIELALLQEISEALNELHDPDQRGGRGGTSGGAAPEK